MGSKSVASITFLILSLSIFFFTTLTSAQDPPPSPCPDLDVCANLLNNQLPIGVGNPESEPCCTIIDGLADADASVCLCELARANPLGLNINVPVQTLLRLCQRDPTNIAACA